ncbi:tyrosine-type recombinase/integrase, partial [Streptomyces sp. NPDC000927]|uniref:tyrosine-type recombinase/integrase n=1 Tax=Streptomyces sp. NPDC000927 TaxID=3154371 RepID=UPI003317C48A
GTSTYIQYADVPPPYDAPHPTPRADPPGITGQPLALGEAYSDSGYVVVHETGEAFTIKQLRRRAYRLMEVLGLRRVRLYDARASCLTFLANNGVSDHILARWAGHTNVKTTKKWYVKPDVEDLREAASTWDGLHDELNGRA